MKALSIVTSPLKILAAQSRFNSSTKDDQALAEFCVELTRWRVHRTLAKKLHFDEL